MQFSVAVYFFDPFGCCQQAVKFNLICVNNQNWSVSSYEAQTDTIQMQNTLMSSSYVWISLKNFSTDNFQECFEKLFSLYIVMAPRLSYTIIYSWLVDQLACLLVDVLVSGCFHYRISFSYSQSACVPIWPIAKGRQCHNHSLNKAKYRTAASPIHCNIIELSLDKLAKTYCCSFDQWITTRIIPFISNVYPAP